MIALTTHPLPLNNTPPARFVIAQHLACVLSSGKYAPAFSFIEPRSLVFAHSLIFVLRRVLIHGVEARPPDIMYITLPSLGIFNLEVSSCMACALHLLITISNN
jgi:hypothetical protein